MTSRRIEFNRMELAGSLGDLGTLLPITIGMIMVNNLSAVGTFFAIGFFYLLAGLYFGVPIAVQPMKVIGAYAIATAMTAQEVSASTLLIGMIFAAVGLTGAINWIGKAIPRPVVRGVQLSTGLLLMRQGVQFMFGTSSFQKATGLAEPYFTHQRLGPLPLGLMVGIAGFALILLLLGNRRMPAALALLGFGLVTGIVLGDLHDLNTISAGLHLPSLLPYGLPTAHDFTVAMFVLVLPQLPMTMGNAVVASVDLSEQYFPEARTKVTHKSLTLSMALASFGSFLLGGIPLCHGAGGLAAHYRFGARTCGSNLIIGAIFLCLGLVFGSQGITLLHLLPMSVLGVLLVFAGAQLGLAILDMNDRNALFVVLTMVGVTLATNLAWAFAAGLLLTILLRTAKISI